MEFPVESDGELPVAYVNLAPDVPQEGRVSKEQVVVEIPTHFRVSELIFDLDESGRIIGVELM